MSKNDIDFVEEKKKIGYTVFVGGCLMLTKEDIEILAELMDKKMVDSENRMMAFFESKIEKQISQIADGHKMLAEKMDRIECKVDSLQGDIEEVKGELTAQELVITRKIANR